MNFFYVFNYNHNIKIALKYALFILFIPATFSFSQASSNSKQLQVNNLPIGSNYDYLCYYGSWDDDKIFRAQDFNLVILEPSNITAAQIQKLKAGHDGILGTSDDVVVIGYVSLGEDNSGNRQGNGTGPCYYNYDSSKVIYENKGYASWYVDDKDKNGLPDSNPNWGSYYVNAGDSLWWNYIKTNSTGTDNTLVVKKCDGLFLDTIDSATPWAPWPYRWTVVGMSNLVHWLRETYPDKYLIANRGLFYFDSTMTQAYAHTIRPDIDADMFESYFIEGDRTTWAKKINHEAQKPDGFKVIALDYFQPNQTSSINQQINEVFSYGWGDYISSSSLNEIRYDVFHRHTVDTNPPTWNSSIGLTGAVAGDQSVTLQWGQLTDQSLPLHFDIYYSSSTAFDTASAKILKNINASFDSVTGTYSYKVDGLNNYTKYNFSIRVRDALGNYEKNYKILNATPPQGSSSTSIIIDGNFSDWANISLLNQAPNPLESSGDSPDPNADFTNFWVTNDTTNLFISYQVAGTISSSYFYHIYIQTDTNNNSGYVYNDSASIGAGYMIENSGLYKYTGTGGTNWSWITAAGMQKADNGNRTELSIPIATLNSTNPYSTIRIIFQVNSAVAPYSLMDIAPDNYKEQYYSYNITRVTGVNETRNPVYNFKLEQNYPNPFNPSTEIRYSLSKSGYVTLKVYNVIGQEIKTLVDDYQTTGLHVINFRAKNLSSGIYFYSIRSGNFFQLKKMVLLK